jgi:transposase
MRCSDTLRILEIMRLGEQGLSQRDIAAGACCAKSTVGDVQRRCKEFALTYTDAQKLTNAEVKRILYPKMGEVQIKGDPDWDDIHRRLQKHRRLNLQYIWTEEYRPVNPNGLSYSQFCRRYREWREKTGRDVKMPRERVPGKELFVDWCGDTLDIVCDAESGELSTSHFFISALGDSGYPFVMAFPDESSSSWLSAHIHNFDWLGGVPRIIVPDNTKTAVTKSNFYDPVLNPAYRELAKHYGVGVVPARVRKPRDKSVVEGSVGWLETWLLEWLRGKRYFSFEELNREIYSRVKVLASRPFSERPGSRSSVFEEVDRPALRPLPAVRYEHAEYVFRKVPDNYTVEYDGFYYSVPYTLFTYRVTLRATLTMIEIIDENGERVALHQRRTSGSRYVIRKEHMPEKHQHQLDADKRDGNSYRSWARTIGIHTYKVIDELLCVQTVEESAYRSCMGVLQMGSRYGKDELESACAKALNMGNVTYTTIKRLLNSLPDTTINDTPTPIHENLRDPAEFN